MAVLRDHLEPWYAVYAGNLETDTIFLFNKSTLNHRFAELRHFSQQGPMSKFSVGERSYLPKKTDTGVSGEKELFILYIPGCDERTAG